MESIEDQIKNLEAKLEQAEMDYCLGVNSGLSDREFDEQCVVLRKLYNNNIPEDSILNRITLNTTDEFKKEQHKTPMLSLSNTYNTDELLDWINKTFSKFTYEDEDNIFCVQEKIDGCSLSCVYENGILKRIVTRGDGTIGEDITCNKFIIEGIPDTIPHNTTIDIRGEVYMEYNEFNRINDELIKNGEEPYKNPRNLTAGTIKILDKNIIKDRKLKFIVHTLGSSEIPYFYLDEFYCDCKLWGFNIVYTKYCNKNTVCSGVKNIEIRRENLPYPIDGAVIKLDSIENQKYLGNTSKSPRWGIAYKYEAEKVRTKVLNITLQVGRIGTITPVAELEPVEISGSVVKRATCHNIDEMIARDIRIGDYVWIEKSGEIIPYILGPIKEERTADVVPYVFNEKCPICGSKAIQFPGLKQWYCSNFDCPGVLQVIMEHFVSRNCMDITDVSGAWIEKFIKAGFLKEFADFFKLTKEQLLTLERMGDKLADKIISNISKATYIEPWRLLHSIGIKGIGKTIAKDVLKAYDNDFNALFNDCQLEHPIKLYTINTIGNVAKQSLYTGLFNNNEVKHLLEHITFKITNIPAFSKLAGKTICITGTHDISRDELIQEIENLGGKVVGSVSKKTDYLLLGKDPGSKYTKAIKLGTKIITNLNEIL